VNTTFTKYHGAGNDYVLLDSPDPFLPPHITQFLCDRHFGVGADGILLASPDPNAHGRMSIYNADGSRAEMCGNGLRCVALHIASHINHTPQSVPVLIATDSGIKSCLVHHNPSSTKAVVFADLGPYSPPQSTTINIDSTPIHLLTTSLGNPHAIVLNPPSILSFEEIAPLIATHSVFPDGTNVTFATHENKTLHARVWERGVGPTLACGTAACALAAIAVHSGAAPHSTPLPIHLPGGTLEVTISESGHATLSGTIHRVFEGCVTVPTTTEQSNYGSTS